MSYGPNFTSPFNWIQNGKNICPIILGEFNVIELNVPFD